MDRKDKFKVKLKIRRINHSHIRISFLIVIINNNEMILYRKVNDGNFGWRALRLLARRSPHFFVHGNYPINKLPEYLETMIKKIAKDRPVSI